MEPRRSAQSCCVGKRGSWLWGAAPAPPAPQFSLCIHESALHPCAEGPITAHCLAVEQLGQRALDALVDVAEPGLVGGHLR
jgi:hypothetical protein